MKTLTVTALLCAIMALTGAAALPEEMSGEEPNERHLVKRSLLCSHGWTRYNGRCFRFIPRAMTWAKAEKNCLSLGGHLASVHSVLEYHGIQTAIMSSSFNHPNTWIGGSDAQEEKQWFWSDGTRFDYTNWANGEPNNWRGHQHCIQMNFGDAKGWDDLQCWTKLPSICAQ